MGTLSGDPLCLKYSASPFFAAAIKLFSFAIIVSCKGVRSLADSPAWSRPTVEHSNTKENAMQGHRVSSSYIAAKRILASHANFLVYGSATSGSDIAGSPSMLRLFFRWR